VGLLGTAGRRWGGAGGGKSGDSSDGTGGCAGEKGVLPTAIVYTIVEVGEFCDRCVAIFNTDVSAKVTLFLFL
jgi:hypothetical protein